ncbi:hypothetical protein V8E51_009953 [Hyaloscypha variabilis]
MPPPACMLPPASILILAWILMPAFLGDRELGRNYGIGVDNQGVPPFLARQSSVSSCCNLVSGGYMISLPGGQSYHLEPRSTTSSVILFRPHLAAADMCPALERRAAPIPVVPTVQSLNIQEQLYQALALGALSLLAVLHRAVLSSGFRIGTFSGTDVTIGAAISTGTLIWYALILGTGWTSDGKPCLNSWVFCVGRLSFAPNILLLSSILWTRSLWEVRSRMSGKPSRLWFQIWRPDTENGQYAWALAFTSSVKLGGILLLVSIIGLFAFGSVQAGQYMVAVLNVVGVSLFAAQATGRNAYNATQQSYDGLFRVVIGTDHVAGTTYVFSGNAGGVSAVYGPCIDEEHRLVNEKTLLWLRSMRTQKTNAVEAGQILRCLGMDLGRRTALSKNQLNVLARWFYMSEPTRMFDAAAVSIPTTGSKDPSSSISKEYVNAVPTSIATKNDFQVAQGSSRIGRESVYALCQLEFLLFSRRNSLEPNSKSFICEWRNLNNTGAEGLDHSRQTMGRGGLDGLKEVLERVGHLLGQENPSLIPITGHLPRQPNFSMLDRYYDTHEEYAAALWEYCCIGSESVLLSLYMFMAVWQTELGAAAGYHPVPLRQKKDSYAGDLVLWSVLWRQGWYTAILAQVTGLLSAVLGAFIAGILH